MTNLEKAQEVNLSLLRKMDSICHEEKIMYFVDGGTLLGAVRHHGFIPWDDDVDVVMFRSDFDKFLKHANYQKDSFKLELPPTKFFYDFVPRIFDTTVSFEKKSKGSNIDKMVEGLYKHFLSIDFFILDKAYRTHFFNLLKKWHMFFLYGLAMGHRAKIEYTEYTVFQSFVIRFCQALGRHIQLGHIYERYWKVAGHGSEHSKYISYSNSITKMNILVKRDYFKESLRVPFENILVNAPVGFDHILEKIYGDYMQLPPKEQRKPMHIKNPSEDWSIK